MEEQALMTRYRLIGHMDDMQCQLRCDVNILAGPAINP
jgi:hypothetical protein